LAVACAGQHPLIYLSGDLGAGKTTLTRGFLRRLGYTGPVKSPTYTLIEPYEVDHQRLFHLDLYRVADPAELEYLGLREILTEPATLLVEWPECGAGWLPEPDIRLHIGHLPDGRRVGIDIGSPRGALIVERLRQHLQ
jgi:tRNA threonylcarbamoyladenosine biosynthesis protein TsaE